MSVMAIGILAATVAECGDDGEVLPAPVERAEIPGRIVGAVDPPPDPADNPCATDAEPSMVDGWICGPPAPKGTGDGADGARIQPDEQHLLKRIARRST